MQSRNRNLWIVGTGMVLATAAHAQSIFYGLNPGSLYERRSCVAPFSQAWELKGSFSLSSLAATDESTKDYAITDIRWSTGKEEITGRGILRVRTLDGVEQLLELDLSIAGKLVHVSGGAHGYDADPLRLVIPLASQEDPICYSTAIVIDAAPAPKACSADYDNDGDPATDKDIMAFFACLAGDCCKQCGDADFDQDGDVATDADIEAFFRVLAGGPC